MANKVSKSVDLVSLDQQALLNDFRNYLRNQDVFKDYDFKGSSLYTLLDVISYNTFKNAFFLNMAFSERWLDSAQLQSSVFSHVKELNYLPRSVRSARAKVKITFSATGQSQPYTIKKGSPLSSIVKSKGLTFTIPETISLTSVDNNFELITDVYEGIFLNNVYIYSEAGQHFKITNPNVDTTSLSVTVYEDGQTTGTEYKYAATLLDLNETSKVFFVQTSEIGGYEVLFGDNILGQQPKINAKIVLEYRVSVGEDGNGAKQFSADFDPTGQNELTSTPVAETIEASQNGVDAETVESIKFYAPRNYQIQERTITNNDYEVALKQAFPEINAVAVYGGEELNPPRFGKVYIAVDIKNVDGLPETKKDEYFKFLKARSAFTITPQFIEPEFLYLDVTSLVRYNLNLTTNSINRIKALVNDAIADYNEKKLNDFKVTFRDSAFSNVLDNADDSIISNITEVAVYRKTNPKLNEPNNISIDFGIAIRDDLAIQQNIYPADDKKAVFSSGFVYQNQTCFIEDNGDGRLRIVKNEKQNKIVIQEIGTVNYETGQVSILNFSTTSYEGNALKIFISPRDKDITAGKNNIMLIAPEDVHLNIEAIRV